MPSIFGVASLSFFFHFWTMGGLIPASVRMIDNLFFWIGRRRNNGQAGCYWNITLGVGY